MLAGDALILTAVAIAIRMSCVMSKVRGGRLVDEAFTSRADETSILLGLWDANLSEDEHGSRVLVNAAIFLISWNCFVEVSAEDEGGLETSIVPIGPGNSGNAAADAKFAGVVVLVLAKRELARTDEVGGSLAARAPVAFRGGDGEAETAGSSPASAGCFFFFLIGSLRGRGMMEMCANGTEDVLVRHFVC
jgi:hypothetical protein